MSAGTVDLPIAGGQLTTVLPARSTTRPREHDGIDELTSRMTAMCESAVDAMEIAAALESDGMNDQAVRSRYGFVDVFTLAEHFYYTVPRRPSEPAAAQQLWHVKRSEHLLHGLLYAIPAVCFPVASSLLTGNATLTAFVGATLVSWALSQALAYLGYVRKGRLDHGGSLRIMRAGVLIALTVLWTGLAGTAWLAPAQIGGLVFAGGQGTYLLAATALVVCGRRRWLLFCLAPGVLVSAGYLALGQPERLIHPVWWALGASVLVTVGCVAVCLLRPPPGGTHTPARHELRGAGTYALFGLAAAGLLSYPVVASQVTGIQPYLAPLLATPLSLSMGAAEWSLYWYRRHTHLLLHNTHDPRQFAPAARRILLATTARYLAVAAVLIAATAGIAATADRRPPRWMTLVECTAFLALGGALFIALLLQAFGADVLTPIACAAALAVEIALTVVTPLNPVVAQLLACVALTAVLFRHAARGLSSAIRHG